MNVRFFVDDNGRDMEMVRHQAEHLLLVLGFDPDTTPELANADRQPLSGYLEPVKLLDRIQRVRNQFVQQLYSEFTSKTMDIDTIVRCLLSLEDMSHTAINKSSLVSFEED